MADRYRFRSIEWPFSIPYGYREVPGGDVVWYKKNYSGSYTVYYSEMWDSRNTKPYPDTNCGHWKGTYEGPDGVAFFDHPLDFGEMRVVIGGIGSPPEMPGVTYTVAEANRFSSAISGALSSSTLAPVFLKELPQIKDVHKQLIGKGFGAKSFANRFLAYKFGILPFISDLSKLLEGHEIISQHIKKVNSMAGQTVRHRMNVGTISGSASWRRPTSASTSVPEYVEYKGEAYTIARIKVFRRYNQQDTLNVYADYYGAKLAQVVWEMIPYSFVVDWFVNIGGVIDYLAPKNQSDMAKLETGCTIVKSSVNLPVQYWNQFVGRAVTLGSRNWQLFSRQKCSGITPSSLIEGGSGLSLSRVTVGGALLIQKLF